MLEQEKLRKADIFSGGLIVLLGLFIVFKAFQMPMKDSWGGVHNVWYVSPAIFPLFVGFMLTLLGSMLIVIAYMQVRGKGLREAISFLLSRNVIRYLAEAELQKFYAIVICLLSFVFIMIPRIDFFLSAAIFLFAFFSMFYLAKGRYLKVSLTCFCVIMLGVILVLFSAKAISPLTVYPGDFFILLALICYMALIYFTAVEESSGTELKLIIGLSVGMPLFIGIIFKYFLLVPMPFEGITVLLLDWIWYADFWK